MKVEEILTKLNNSGYLANKEIAYALLGAIDSSVPLLVEGDPGVGKSSLAIAAAKALNVPVIRMQCYDGITPDIMLYDYNYQKLMTPAVDASDAGYTYHKDILNSWSYNNTSSTVPRFVFGDQYTAMASDRWLTSAKYLNFQSFTVGYSVPKKLVAKLHLSKVRIYAAGENLCFWSARKGLDPRYSFQETESVNTYSPMRTISGGVQLSF